MKPTNLENTCTHDSECEVHITLSQDEVAIGHPSLHTCHISHIPRNKTHSTPTTDLVIISRKQWQRSRYGTIRVI